MTRPKCPPELKAAIDLTFERSAIKVDIAEAMELAAKAKAKELVHLARSGVSVS